jgi:hypothetical protein
MSAAIGHIVREQDGRQSSREAIRAKSACFIGKRDDPADIGMAA